MKELLITILLIAALNIPVFIDLYKHLRKRCKVWVLVAACIAFWALALTTQTFSAFIGILYLFFAEYRMLQRDENDLENRDLWRISRRDSLIVLGLAGVGRAVLAILNIIFVIILAEIVKYNIKPQEIVTYYSQAQLWLRIILVLDIVLVAPVVEEYVFRHFLYGRTFSPRMPKIFAAVLAATLFTIPHFNVSGIPTFFGLGLLCAYMYEKKGYWGAVITHATANFISLWFM